MELIPVSPAELSRFKADMQEAFQKGYEAYFGKTDAVILPEKDIDESLNTKGAAAYKAMLDGVPAGGAVVVVDEQTHHSHLHLLFVKNGIQGRGIGKSIWFQLEKLYPDTEVWETCTPYFERRNIHFYVNVCGFHIVSFYSEQFPMPGTSDDFAGDGGTGMFVFQKFMKPMEQRNIL